MGLTMKRRCGNTSFFRTNIRQRPPGTIVKKITSRKSIDICRIFLYDLVTVKKGDKQMIKVKLFIDEKDDIVGEISWWDWTLSLLSMIIHPNNRMKWRFFKVIKNDHPAYQNWNYLYVTPHAIDWSAEYDISKMKLPL